MKPEELRTLAAGLRLLADAVEGLEQAELDQARAASPAERAPILESLRLHRLRVTAFAKALQEAGAGRLGIFCRRLEAGIR